MADKPISPDEMKVMVLVMAILLLVKEMRINHRLGKIAFEFLHELYTQYHPDEMASIEKQEELKKTMKAWMETKF